MKKNTIYDYAEALFDLTKDQRGERLQKILQAFAAFLYKKNILKRAPQIIAAYEAYSKKQAGIISLKITTARDIDTKTVEHIKKVFGSTVEATQAVDTSLIGGVVIATEDAIFDASLKTQLRRLEQSLS